MNHHKTNFTDTTLLCEVAGSGGRKRMEMDLCVSVPPGFRFHPTEEELVGYYLRRKINSLKIDLDVIVEFDLYRMEPWDIQDKCKLGYEEQNEWYFFSHKDRKYPTGTRTNRATASGFWKATGRDKAVLSKDKIIGMRKTLVYYKGRAPNGRKSDWIMHEYRLQTSEHGPPQEEGWVVCRAFKKPSPSHKQGFEAWNNSCNIGNNSRNFRPTMKTFNPFNIGPNFHHQPPFPSQTGFFPSHSQMVDIPKLDSPSMCTSFTTNDNKFLGDEDMEDEKSSFVNDQYSDWKSFNKLLGSHQGTSSSSCSNMPLTNHNDEHLNSLLECLPDL